MNGESGVKIPKYDPSQTYDWNFKKAPKTPPEVEVPECPGEWTYCGIPVNSPLGIAAGPLLNGKWVSSYAALGFDVLTYKTVRTDPHECYPLPNLVPVQPEMMTGDEASVPLADELDGSWAVSFGMPSQAARFWIGDVKKAKARLSEGQLLSVSVVGTMQPGWGLEELADNYADCASWAFDANADCVEMNFSCPNVCSEDGQLFQNPADAALVAKTVQKYAGEDGPLLVKIGYLADQKTLQELLIQLNDHVDAIVTTNSIPTRVTDSAGKFLFDGEQRGICGDASRDLSIEQVRRCREIVEANNLKLDIIGVGGIKTADDVQRYLDAGANSVQLATSAMIDPLVGIKIRQNFNTA
ncbi:beta/alpha barrel domain-containing protein [Thalassoglobus polymorphus]|uniref:Dihydroorotate dehydrogenase B (NAD(+)), catalytic subunit n=1 Tax=Thalassoglobus polymorphus TaxID=2527994 RepID=A0A517QKL1_9PLAN|nr:hypothetical protein [Thalassoglobus polymorphus]QDT32176.1 Dihydroorotate dehydrogenase B (NAD(+)), catalytic subunit [Thalassoglobus polymorphus]